MLYMEYPFLNTPCSPLFVFLSCATTTAILRLEIPLFLSFSPRLLALNGTRFF